jgi:hypothetical protein
MRTPDLETYQAYGRAMHAAQRLERAVANAVVATTPTAARSGIPPRSRTLGRLVRDLGTGHGLRATLEADLELALQQRNWLAHRFFRHTGPGPGGVLRRAPSLEELAAELDALAAELQALVKSFGHAVDSGDTYYLH